MFTDPAPQQASSWLPTVITGVLLFIPALLGAMVTWWRDLGTQAARLRVLDEAKKTVEFWDALVKACEGIEGVSTDRKRTVLNELNHASEKVIKLNPVVPRGVFHRFINRSDRFTRWFFLYKAPNGRVRSRRAMFYISVVLYPTEIVLLTLRHMHRTGRLYSHIWTAPGLIIALVCAVGYFYWRVVISVKAAIKTSEAEEAELIWKEERQGMESTAEAES